MSGRPRDVTRDDLTAEMSRALSRKEAELIEANCRTTTANERAERAIRWAVTLEQQLAEAVRLLKEAYAMEGAGFWVGMDEWQRRTAKAKHELDRAAFLQAVNPTECPECGGAGEGPTGDTDCGVPVTAICSACGGLG